MLRSVSGFVNDFFVLKVYFRVFCLADSLIVLRASARPSCVKARGRSSSCMITEGAMPELLHL